MFSILDERVSYPSTQAPLTERVTVGHKRQQTDKLYTIVLYLAGQQASGIQALLSLQCQAKHLGLPLTILEPVIPVTEFKAMPPSPDADEEEQKSNDVVNHSVMKFSDIFDMSYFNELSSRLNYAQLSERDFFFETAPRRIVFVNIHEGLKGQEPLLSRLWPLNNSYSDCFSPLLSHDLIDDVKSQLDQITRMGFCIVKAVDYRFTHGKGLIFSESQLKQSILGDHSHHEITLAFNIWMAKFAITGHSARKCASVGYKSSKEQLRPSKQLLTSIQFYENQFLKSKTKVALMVRLEHIHVFVGQAKGKREQWTVERCLNAAMQKTEALYNNGSHSKPFMTLDIGKYGSIVMKYSEHLAEDTKLVNQLLSSLYNGEWDLEKWEETFTKATGGIEDSSYIAALQRTLASKAECLILVGGGMFQELTMRKYMSTHAKTDWCIHLFCIKDRANYIL